jgi:hypothetical protein
MQMTQIVVRAVRNGDHVILSVYVESEKRWGEALASPGEIANIRDVLDQALATKAR